MASEPPKHLFTVLCEDIRKEELNKVSLMGVYSDRIYFQKRPLQIRSLAFFNRFSEGRGTFSLAFHITGPKSELIFETKPEEAKFPIALDSPITSISLVLGNFEFKDEGPHNFEVHLDDQKFATFPFDVRVKPGHFSEGNLPGPPKS